MNWNVSRLRRDPCARRRPVSLGLERLEDRTVPSTTNLVGNVAGIAAVDPSTDTWYVRNEPSPGAPDAGTFQYGATGWVPVAGDWTGGGQAGIGVVDLSTNTWYLRNE